MGLRKTFGKGNGLPEQAGVGWGGVRCWASRTFSAGKMLRSDEGGPGMGVVSPVSPFAFEFSWKICLETNT